MSQKWNSQNEEVQAAGSGESAVIMWQDGAVGTSATAQNGQEL